MIRNFCFTLFALLILTFEISASNTIIKGVVENAEGYVFRLKSYSDNISFQDTILAESLLDESGTFEFQIETEYPQLIVLKLGFQIASFYIEPGKDYHLKVIYDPESEQVSYLANHKLLFEFIDLPKDDLNSLVDDFNRISDRFLIKNFEKIYKRKQFQMLDSLRYETFSIRRKGGDYFGDLIEFRIADILLSAKKEITQDIFFKYFGNKAIRYEHYEYMVFFNTFFDKYLRTKTRVLKPGELRSLVNDQDDLIVLSKALKRDLLLMDDRLRELVILRELYNFFYDFEFQPVKVLGHIRNLAQNSTYPEHRLIAKNLIKRITSLQPGSKLPEFNFMDLKGFKKTNADYKGKYLLLNFWELDCSDCFNNIDSLEYIQKTYADKLQVISVSSHKYVNDLKRIIGEQNFTMNFLLASPDNRVYDDLKIRSLPAVILVDDEGKIVLFPAILPARGFRNTFKSVFKH